MHIGLDSEKKKIVTTTDEGKRAKVVEMNTAIVGNIEGTKTERGGGMAVRKRPTPKEDDTIATEVVRTKATGVDTKMKEGAKDEMEEEKAEALIQERAQQKKDNEMIPHLIIKDQRERGKAIEIMRMMATVSEPGRPS
jgi:hypothetical protein